MTDDEFKELFEVYEVLSSGRIDQAKKMLEKIIGINPEPVPETA